MKVVVINLEKDVSKHERVKNILHTNNIDYSIFKAIYGNDLPENNLLAFQKNASSFFKNRGKFLNPAEIGLYLSHIELLQWFVNSDLNVICVLEDDFDLVPNFKESIDEIEEKIDFFDFEILMIGHFLYRKDKGISGFFQNVKNGKFVSVKIPLEPNYGTHAYVITKEGAKKIINKFSQPLCPIDHVLGVSELFNIKRKITSKPIVYQSDLFQSSIQIDDFKNQKILYFYFKRAIKIMLFSLCPSLAITRMKVYISKSM
jgi:glycosyl transferase family 25